MRQTTTLWLTLQNPQTTQNEDRRSLNTPDLYNEDEYHKKRC